MVGAGAWLEHFQICALCARLFVDDSPSDSHKLITAHFGIIRAHQA